jgi:hypothetical protein
MTAPRPDQVHKSGRAYARLLRLLPAEFRAAYGQPVLQTFLDMCSAGVHERGRRGLLAVWSRVLPDLAVCAAREWTARLWRRIDDRPPVGSRLAAAALPVLGALLVIYSQLRYPANLTLPEYVFYYLALLASLAVLTAVLLASRAAAPVVVLCGFASTPGWVLMFHIARPGAAALVLQVLFLIAVASLVEARRTPTVAAGARAGAVTGALAGLSMLIVNVTDGLTTMASAGQDTEYVTEFARSGQRSLAAYVIGERIGGGAFTIIYGVVIGALIGLAATAATALVRRGSTLSRRAAASGE